VHLKLVHDASKIVSIGRFRGGGDKAGSLEGHFWLASLVSDVMPQLMLRQPQHADNTSTYHDSTTGLVNPAACLQIRRVERADPRCLETARSALTLLDVQQPLYTP
jgi:hypothetical protein